MYVCVYVKRVQRYHEEELQNYGGKRASNWRVGCIGTCSARKDWIFIKKGLVVPIRKDWILRAAGIGRVVGCFNDTTSV
jgi:hypothetical protein